MNIEQVKCVLAVVRYKTYLEAAFQLNRSQAAVSKSIQKLEQELGTSLFNRTTRKVSLTPAGEDFVIYGQQILDSYENILNSVERHTNPQVKTLRIGTIYFGQNNPLAPVIARYLKLHPNTAVNIRDDTSTPLIRSLHSGGLDVVFVSSMYTPSCEQSPYSMNPHFKAFSCFQDPYYVIVSREHPFACRESLNYQDLNGQPFITIDASMDVYHEAIKKALEASNVSLHTIMNCSSVRSVLHMVSQNLGIAILTKLVVEDSDLLRIIPLENGMIRDTQMLVLNKELPSHVRAFCRFIREQLT